MQGVYREGEREGSHTQGTFGFQGRSDGLETGLRSGAYVRQPGLRGYFTTRSQINVFSTTGAVSSGGSIRNGSHRWGS